MNALLAARAALVTVSLTDISRVDMVHETAVFAFTLIIPEQVDPL